MNALFDNTRSGQRSWRRLLPLAAMVALALAGIGAQSASAKQSVPLTSSVAGTLSGSSPDFTLHGTGQASHLGNVNSYDATVHITNVDPDTGRLTDTLTETLTAANGDTITILCQQVAYPVSPGSPVLEGSDTWTVIGGTGRFSNASGSGTGHTHADLGAGTFTKDMTGNIMY
jgi:hypothetical protein